MQKNSQLLNTLILSIKIIIFNKREREKKQEYVTLENTPKGEMIQRSTLSNLQTLNEALELLT